MTCRTSVRDGALALVAALVATLPATAAAQDRDGRAVVAVLPLGAEAGMQIYSKPVADAVAQKLATDRRMAVESLSLTGSVPARVDLVIDGRIVSHGEGAIALEARVRDPARGRLVAVAATGARPLAQIDALAEELARKLATPLSEAVEHLRRQRSAEARAGAVPARAVPVREPAARQGAPAGARAAPAAGARPGMLVMQATGRVADGAVPVEGVVTRAGYRLADALGFAPVASAQAGVLPGAAASAELGSAGAAFALMLDVREIDFAWKGVLTARGSVRVVVVDAGGRVIYDRLARTDTLVGSRGDRHAALIHFVAEQVVDIVAPELRRRLAR